MTRIELATFWSQTKHSAIELHPDCLLVCDEHTFCPLFVYLEMEKIIELQESYMQPVGIGPTTLQLKGACSTTELIVTVEILSIKD